ncbi:MAG: aldo/keto reductase [Desulfobacteraceae bacterium]|nr:aldo/keto reductase [Desulfobacteraceae bacterium]
MEYRNLGNSGLKVGRLCLGTMTFGWGTPEAESRRLLDKFVDIGGNFIDTADIYADGESESIIGRWMKDRSRDKMVIATKVRFETDDHVNGAGLNRKHILTAVENSLRRLKTDHIDVYQVHCWDDGTPLEETLATLDRLVASGKVRYIGASNFLAWQLQKAVDLSGQLGVEKFICLQAMYNLLDRLLEWELIPVCENEDLGLLCWSPLGGGWLTGKFHRGMSKPPKNSRVNEAEKEGWSESWSNYNTEQTWQVLDTFLEIAREAGRTPSQVAINWLLNQSVVTCPIIGVRTFEQFEDNIKSIEWNLDQDHLDRLSSVSEPQTPRYPYGFIKRFKR